MLLQACSVYLRGGPYNGKVKTYQTRGLLALLLALSAAFAAYPAASAEEPQDIRGAHREAARRYQDFVNSGLKLSGSVDENGTQGSFEAWFSGGVSVVRQKFGAVDSFSYSGPEGNWTGSSTSMPYQLEPQDSPAQTVLSMIGSGDYLTDEYWPQFSYEGEEAGGYRCRFAPAGLPPVSLLLYSDPAEPWYLQVRSVELKFCPSDASSSTYRAYYYFTSTPEGKLYTNRETGHEIDSQGDTVSFSDYSVDHEEPLAAIPPEAAFRFDRLPPGGAGSGLSAPVDIAVDCSKGYFLVPLSFPGSDKTWVFLLDTGASASLFSPAAADAAQVSGDLQIPAHGHGTRVDFEIGLCNGASVGRADAPAEQRVALTPFTVARIAASNRDVLEVLASYGADGILGVALLNQFVVRFDHSAGTLTLIPQQLFDPATMVKKPNIEFVVDAEDLFFITGVAGDGQSEPVKGELCVDTGLQSNLALLRETVEGAGLKLEKVAEQSSTVLGGVKRFDYVKVPRFEIGPMSYSDVTASLTEDDNGNLSARKLLGFIGVPLFFSTRITVDLFNQRMYVEPLDPSKLEEMLKGPPKGPQAEPEKPADEKGGATKLPVEIGQRAGGGGEA